METFMGAVVPFIVGIVCIVLGISNRKGNISSLHSYHRNRVSEEDRMAFGKKVGLGTILIGCAIIAFSILSVLALVTEQERYTLLGTVVMVAGLVVGLGISFAAMKKYNGGIF